MYKTIRTSFLKTIAGLYLIGPAFAAGQSTDQGQGQDEELQMGQEVFNQLKAKGEIVESSPLYDQLRPIADAITRGLDTITHLSSTWSTKLSQTHSQRRVAMCMWWIHSSIS